MVTDRLRCRKDDDEQVPTRPADYKINGEQLFFPNANDPDA
jgi:hypothetical protein